MDQESNTRQALPTIQPQHLTQTTKTTSSSPGSMSKPLSTGHTTIHRSSEKPVEASAAAVDATTSTNSSRYHGLLKRDTRQLENNSSSRMPLTADQFSSSLASIASTSARQALHHQQSSSSSSSSSDSSREAMVVTATATENSASAGSNTNSNSGSGEENRESGGDVKIHGRSPAIHSHHHAHTTRRNRRGDDFGLSLRVDDDSLQQQAYVRESSTNHHATVVARLPPPASESSLSSSGNETSLGPAYHTIRLTLQNTNKSINFSSSSKKRRPSPKASKKQPPQQETTSSDSSGSLMRHHRHHHASKRPASSMRLKDGSDNKKMKLKTSPSKSSSSTTCKKQRAESNTADSHIDAPHTAATEDDENYGSNSSSGSGTEAGYAGSASSNGNKGEGSNGSSTSNSSSDIPDFSSGASEGNAYPFATSPSNSPSLSSSNGEDDEDDISEDDRRKNKNATTAAASKAGRRWLPQSMEQRQLQEDRKPPAKPAAAVLKESTSSSLVATAQSHFTKISRAGRSASTTASSKIVAMAKPKARRPSYPIAPTQLLSSAGGKPPILTLGSDLMAHVLTFLEPPEILRVLTMPLSRDWSVTFAGQQELWRVLCLLEPFKAQVEEEDFSSSSSSSSSNSSSDEDEDDDGSLSSFSAAKDDVPPAPVWKNRKGKSSHVAPIRRPLSAAKSKSKSQRLPKLGGKLGKYRLLYTSFVRCMKYLARMKEDVLHGRPPSIQDYGRLQPTTVITSPRDAIGSNRSLQQFLAGARGVVQSQQRGADAGEQEEGESPAAAASMPIMSADDGSNSYQSSIDRRRKRKKTKETRTQQRRKKPKFGRSMLTDRLLGPTASGDVNPDNVALPWSCALYSIVNWMVAFADVEGIQVMCLKVLPYLLEDEQQRITAQRVGLTDVILRGMILFPHNVQLHTASFHTLVLLARPLGGREGMLFHSSMVSAAGIFSGGDARNDNNADGEDTNELGGTISGGPRNDGKNGIAVMLDSMRRFEADGALQAMSCWSLVNIALAPVQKEVLVKLGGIEATTNAMMRHPHNAEVQFRALFALINLVIPSVNMSEASNDNQDDAGNEGFAAELDEAVGQITNLVVVAMKNFCASEAILNRACLVLHNLSLTQAYHSTLLWTPNCYQMLEWCLANYRTDQVLQQSAAGTLHRLQVTLSNDENLRTRFAASIQAQQQLSLEAAHREALHIYEQQEQLRQEREGRSAGTAQ